MDQNSKTPKIGSVDLLNLSRKDMTMDLIFSMSEQELWLHADFRTGPSKNLETEILFATLRPDEWYSSRLAAQARWSGKRESKMSSRISGVIGRMGLSQSNYIRSHGKKLWQGEVLWDRFGLAGQIRGELGLHLINLLEGRQKCASKGSRSDTDLLIKQLQSMSACSLRKVIIFLTATDQNMTKIRNDPALESTIELIQNAGEEDYRKILHFFGSDLKLFESNASCYHLSEKESYKLTSTIEDSSLLPDKIKNKRRKVYFGFSLKSPYRSVKIFCLSAIILMVFACVDYYKSPASVYDVLETQGPRKALKYLLANKVKGQYYRYMVGWVKFSNGAYAEAESEVIDLLSSNGITPKIKGDCYYLLGNITSALGEYDESIGYLNIAAKIYKANGLPSFYYVEIERAHTFLNLGFLVLAENILLEIKKTEAYFDNNKKQLWMSVCSLLYIKRGQYLDAVKISKERVNILTESKVGYRADAYTNLGFSYALIGDLNLAEQNTDIAESIIFNLDDKKRRLDNLLNRMLIKKLRGLNYTHIEVELDSQSKKFPHLKPWLSFIRNLKLNEAKVM